MTKLPTLFALAACAIMTMGCLTEEGYTPIGEDREDKGGGLFYLSAEERSASVYFSCDDDVACDLQLNVALTSDPGQELVDGQEALHATLLSPNGESDKSETMVIGSQDSTGIDNSLLWSYQYLAIPPGDYSIALDLGTLNGAQVRVGTIEL